MSLRTGYSRAARQKDVYKRQAVIDDEKYSRSELIHQIREVLPQAEVLEAANGAQGLKLLDRNSFDLLFIDIHLGDMEGTTVASLARKINPKSKDVYKRQG